MKTYVKVTHLKRLTEAHILCTHDIFSWRNKKNINTFVLKKAMTILDPMKGNKVEITRFNPCPAE